MGEVISVCVCNVSFLLPEMLPEQLRTVVQKRLSAVADEICRILEIMLGEHEAEDIEQQCQLLDITTGTLYMPSCLYCRNDTFFCSCSCFCLLLLAFSL